MQRRQFLSSAAAAALFSTKALARGQAQDSGQPLLTEVASGAAAKRIPRVSSAGTMRGEMLYRDLGATGVQVSVIGMGGSHIGQATVTKEAAIRLIHEGLDRISKTQEASLNGKYELVKTTAHFDSTARHAD